MYNIKLGQLIEVEWIDPSVGDSGWVNSKTITDLPKMICRSVGWVHLVNDDGVILTACYCLENEHRDLLFHQNLPWGCITQIWILKS